MSSIASRIYQAVQKSGLSYGDIAKETGYPKSAIQRYATGETKNIPLPRIEAIAKATNVSAAYLMGWEEEDPAPSPQQLEMSEKIKYLRTKHGLTLEQVGAVVGVGKSTVRKWESGMIANMRRDKIAKLAEALHTTPAFLMGWEEENPAPSSPQQQMVMETVQMLMDLTPQEVVQVTAFVAGLKAARAAAQSPPSSDPK